MVHLYRECTHPLSCNWIGLSYNQVGPVATGSCPVATSSVQLQLVYSPSCNRGKLLERKRCLIVLVDLSSAAEWDTIIQSLPKMENASKIVITTREENIAKCCSPKQEDIYKLEVLENRDALDLFTKKVFISYILLNLLNYF